MYAIGDRVSCLIHVLQDGRGLTVRQAGGVVIGTPINDKTWYHVLLDDGQRLTVPENAVVGSLPADMSRAAIEEWLEE